ncbi:MAG: ATP-binding protein [Desulfobacteraceae bacterium]|nr:MAG: ATP-binding protein [Desulfobacteraceae bacterium]
MEIIDRFFNPPLQSYFLFGPRGTGKSTFIRQFYKNHLYVDLLEPERMRLLSAHPEQLKEIVEAYPDSGAIVIDEIQRIPELLSVVHGLIEKKKEWRFILTGSSARKLKRTGVDMLGGRALLCTLHPFMAAELGSRFDFHKALRYGLLPVVVGSESPEEVLRAYAALYLREEVQLEGLVRNLGSFSRFLEAISFSHASALNVSNVARDCNVERKVVEGYVGVLEDILLGWRLPIFSKRAKRQLAQHPKFFLMDTGVFRSLRPQGPLDRSEEIEGQALEGLVAQHLKAWAAYAGIKREFYFWRTRAGVEVDFIVYGPDGIWAIEVKNNNNIRPADLRGLRSFQDEYPESKAFLLYRGKDRLKKGDILCLPCEEFLKKLHPATSLDEIYV